MSKQDILALAKQGEPGAIAFEISGALPTKDITVTVCRLDNSLHVVLTAAIAPSQQHCVESIRKRFERLQVAMIHSVRVYGRQMGEKNPAWSETFELGGLPRTKPFSVSPYQQHQQSPPCEVVPINSDAIAPELDPQPKTPQAPSRKFSFTRKKTKILLPLLGAISFLLGSGWELAGNSQPLSIPERDSYYAAPTHLDIVAPVAVERVLHSNENLYNNATQTVLAQVASPSPPSEPVPQALNNWQNDKLVAKFSKLLALVDSTISPTPITLKAVGDIIPGTTYPDTRLPARQEILFESVKPQLQGADILFGNFESTLTDYPKSAKETGRGMVFAFRTPPAYAKLLQETGFDVLSVANNHSMDFFEEGFEDTIKNIENAGMKAVGKKGKIVYMTIKNVPFAFIAFSNYDYHNAMNDLPDAKALVEEANKNASIVVISVHAGAEGTDALHVRNKEEMFYGENRGNMVLFSHTMIDAGADLILGHGPHVTRALELYKGKMIAYSLGNFLGYQTLSTEAELGYSLILEVKMNPEGDFISGKIIPVQLDDDGIPYIDQNFRSVDLIRSLTQSDFPNTPLTIDRSGKISKQ